MVLHMLITFKKFQSPESFPLENSEKWLMLLMFAKEHFPHDFINTVDAF